MSAEQVPHADAPSDNAVSGSAAPSAPSAPDVGSEAHLEQALRAYILRQSSSGEQGPADPALAAYARLKAAQMRPAVDPLSEMRRGAAQSMALPSRVQLKTPDVFRGDRTDVARFVRSVERYVRASGGMADDVLLSWVPMLLGGVAETWWDALEQDDLLPRTWLQFVLLLRERFDDPAAVRKAREKLDNIRLTGTVAALRQEFEAAALRVPGLSAAEQTHLFVSKLQGPIRVHVEMGDPSTLRDAFRLAEKAELAEAASRGRSAPQDPDVSERNGRSGRRGRGQRNSGEADQTGAAAVRQNGRQTPPWRPPMGLAIMSEGQPSVAPLATHLASYPAHGNQQLIAMQNGQQGQAIRRQSYANLTEEQLTRCYAEFRCYWCKVPQLDLATRHTEKMCPARLRGDPVTPMPPRSQDVRVSGNGSGRPRQ